jgi:methyl-accepting chemotaxis protein
MKPTLFNRRKLRNFLLQPALQAKFGVYTVLLSFVFASLVFGILYLNLSDFMDIMSILTDGKGETQALFRSYIFHTRWWLACAVVLYFLANIVLSVVITHRLVGPTVAFRAHIQRLCVGNFQSRVHLRKGDAFGEVADDLNRLAAILEEKTGKINGDSQK